jgi:hypothetical protein
MQPTINSKGAYCATSNFKYTLETLTPLTNDDEAKSMMSIVGSGGR